MSTRHRTCTTADTAAAAQQCSSIGRCGDPPYLVMMPVGVSVYEITRLYGKSVDARRFIKNTIKSQISSLLAHVHNTLRFCHTDIRPQNLIFTELVTADNSREGGKLLSFNCVLIDWGLMTAIGAPMHTFTGGIDFMHNRCLRLE